MYAPESQSNKPETNICLVQEADKPSLPSLSSYSLLNFELVHQVAGRVRLRLPELLTEDDLEQSLAEAIAKIEGITTVRINRWCASIIIHFDETLLPADRLLSKVRKLNVVAIPRTEQPRLGSRFLCLLRIMLGKIERIAPPLVQLIIGGAALGSSLLQAPFVVTATLTSLATVPIAGRALQTVVNEGKIGVDGLDGMAAGLMIAQKNIAAASFMIALIGLGEFIRELTAQRCKKIMDDLLGLAGCSAWLVKGNKRICIPAEQVEVGDIIVVYPGELIPVDGEIIKGQASVNQASLTGEALPVEVTDGNSVFASTFLLEGKIYVRCSAEIKDSRAGQVIQMINAAPVYETRTENYASQLADKLVLPILGTALLCGLTTRNITRVMSIMIFDFSTGIRIAAPTAVLASMQRAGRHGILIKSGGALERLAQVDAIVLDKTGTLTLGEPKVTIIQALNGFSEDKVLAYAAAVEERSHHPAARAIVRYAHENQVDIPDRFDSQHEAGLGVTATVDNLTIQVGSRRMMESKKIDLSLSEEAEQTLLARGESLAYVAINGKVAGLIGYADQLRPEVPKVIKMLRKRGIKKIFMATGDHETSAHAIAAEADIKNILSNVFPEQKAHLVQTLQEEGYTVAVVGDGINDSPALAHADLGISLHSATKSAQEHADVLLTDNDLSRLPQAIDIARGSMALVRENLGFIAIPNGAGIFLAATGAIGPAMSTLLNNGSAILAALNSLRPLISNSWSQTEEDGIT